MINNLIGNIGKLSTGQKYMEIKISCIRNYVVYTHKIYRTTSSVLINGRKESFLCHEIIPELAKVMNSSTINGK